MSSGKKLAIWVSFLISVLVVIILICSNLVFPKWWIAYCRKFYMPDKNDLVCIQLQYEGKNFTLVAVNGLYRVETDHKIYWVNDAVYQSVLRTIFRDSSESVRNLDGSYKNVTARLESTDCPNYTTITLSDSAEENFILGNALYYGRSGVTDYTCKFYTLSMETMKELDILLM